MIIYFVNNNCSYTKIIWKITKWIGIHNQEINSIHYKITLEIYNTQRENNKQAKVYGYIIDFTKLWEKLKIKSMIRSRPKICTYICAIGGTSRATFDIPAIWLNITIYPILWQRWFKEMLHFRRFLELFQLWQLLKPSVVYNEIYCYI